MIFSLINANHDDPELDLKVSELIYALESKEVSIDYILLKSLTSEAACDAVHKSISKSEMIIYVCPVDSEKAMDRLIQFNNAYKEDMHPYIYIILDSKRLLSVDEVTEFIDYFEDYAQAHDVKIIDVKYFKDARNALT
jgi:hypothetical protein